ncbi:Phosphatidylinositol 3; 4; 5-trisphosphate-dependent Rac exchanger 1 protein, partial [Camelus dromedarius]
LPSTITETTSGGSCDPRLAEEASPPPLISEDSETDGTDHGGMKKVCVKLSEEDREDSGHDTMRYRDSYLWGSVLPPHRLPSTITETTSGGSCDPRLAEESSSPPLVSEESEMDRTDHGGMKKVCVKLSEEDREDSGHDTMSYRDSYSECDSNQHSVLSYTSVRSDGSYLRSHEMRSVECRGSCWGRGASSEISFC